jgi:hypothetical protein
VLFPFSICQLAERSHYLTPIKIVLESDKKWEMQFEAFLCLAMLLSVLPSLSFTKFSK